MTSTARPSSEGGIGRPSALAVWRLMTNTNLVGCHGQVATTAMAARATVCHAHAALERRPCRKSTTTWECDQNRAVSGAQPREPWDFRGPLQAAAGGAGFDVSYAHVGTRPAWLSRHEPLEDLSRQIITFRRPTTGLAESFTSCRSTPYSTSPFSSARPIASFPQRSCTQFSSPSDEGTLPLLCRRRIRTECQGIHVSFEFMRHLLCFP